MVTEPAGISPTKVEVLRDLKIKAHAIAYHSRVASETWRHLYTEGQHLREVQLLAENILVQLEYVDLAIRKDRNEYQAD